MCISSATCPPTCRPPRRCATSKPARGNKKAAFDSGFFVVVYSGFGAAAVCLAFAPATLDPPAPVDLGQYVAGQGEEQPRDERTEIQRLPVAAENLGDPAQ